MFWMHARFQIQRPIQRSALSAFQVQGCVLHVPIRNC
jgi:hypothetical protein